MRRNQLDRIADAISDGGPIGWDAELASAPASLLSSLKRLRQLGELASACRAVEAPQASQASRSAPRSLFRWGHLEARSRLGRGSFGDVYLAIDSRLQRPVALKLRRRRSNGATPSPRRFLEEARRLARVSHPNVVIVHGADIHRGRAGFWTELITGETLASRLASVGTLEVGDVTRIGLELSRALGAVHAAGLVHGDVKAENVMQDESGRTVLMDFGAASRLDPVARGLPDSPYLTPCAAAPEVLNGAPPHPTADIYSLGVLLYRLVSGAYPIEAQTFAELQEAHRREATRSLADRRPDLPPEFVATVDRALAPRAIDRFQSASELEGALRAALRAGASSAPVVGTQSLRAMIQEEGRIPEPLCLEIARGIALALRPLHDSGRVHGRLDLDTVQVLSDGTVSLGAADSTLAVTNRRDDLRALGGLLAQMVAGELGPQVSPFFRELVRELLESDAESALSAAALAEIFEQGPRGAWWRSRARELRLKSRRAPRRISMPRETALHGRDPQVEELLTLWARAKSGEGQVALVVGEAGIGKSRLVDHFVGLLEQQGESFHFLFGSHPPGGGATALGAYCDAYREHLGGDRLEETLAEYLPDTPHLAATLAALFQGAPTGGDRFTRDSMQSAFVELTRALSAEQPTIVMVDDLHFAPEESRSLFAALAAAGRGQPLLLLGTARPELPEEWVAAIARLEHARTVVLPRLSQEQVGDLLSDAFHSTPLSFPFTEELGVRSDGNPYFLLEIVRSLRARVIDSGASASASTLLRGVPVPFSIAQLVAARIAALETEDDRELLDLACCVGFRFDPSLVAEAAQIEPVRALRRFARIERRQGLVRADGSDYAFDHHQAQEFVYSALGVQLRQHYHSAIATALRSRSVTSGGAEMDGESAAAICAHELRGIDPSRGLALLVPALDHLESHYANAAAIDLAERALAVPGLSSGSDRARVLLRRGARLSFIGRRVEAQSAYEEAYALVDPESDVQLGGEIEGCLGGQFRIAGDHPRAIEFLERGIRHAEIAQDLSSEGKTRLELGTVFFHTGRHAEAETEYRRAVEIARDRGDRAGLCQAESYLSSLLSEGGRLVEAERLIRRSLDEARDLGNVNLELSSLATLASMLLDQGRTEDAIESSTRMLELSRKFGVRSGESIAWINLGCGLASIGRYEEGRARLEQAVRVGPELRTRDHEAYALCHLGLIFGFTGDLGRSREALDACTALCAEFDFGWLDGDVRSARGAVAELQEDFAGAERWQLEALAIARERENVSGIARALTCLGRVAARLGRADEARSHLTEAARAALESAAIPETVAAQAELALLGFGDVAEAIAHFERDRAYVAHSDQLRTRFRFFQATANHGHLEAARRLLNETLAAVPETERARVLNAIPLYRAIEDAT